MHLQSQNFKAKFLRFFDKNGRFLQSVDKNSHRKFFLDSDLGSLMKFFYLSVMKKGKSSPQYFKRVFDDYQVLVKVDPDTFTGIELIIHPDGKVEKTALEFDEEIFDDLEVDEFKSSNPLEFELYLTKA